LHTPSVHLSPVVQMLPSSQVAVFAFGVFKQLPSSQLSLVQTSPSSQLICAPGLHKPSLPHLSLVVQASPSLQASPVKTSCKQPLPPSHESLVQGLPSSQSSAFPFSHDVPEHASLPLHRSPSAQEVPGTDAGYWQEPLAQASAVQASVSVQSLHSTSFPSLMPQASSAPPGWQAPLLSRQPRQQLPL
jgi:hypothetical protein